MPDEQLSSLDTIKQKHGLGGAPIAAAPKTDLSRVGTDREPSAQAAPALSPLESIKQKFGLSAAPKAAPAVPKEDFTNKYNTPLTPDQERKFQGWAKGRKNAAGGMVLNDLPDYDVRGRWQQLEAMSPEERAKAETPGAHGPDTFKKPSHITFSTESKYHGAEGHEGGVWGKDAEGKDTFTPGSANLKFHGPEGLQKYFTEQEPGLKLLPTKPPGELPQALAPTRAPAAPPGEHGFLGEIGASIAHGAGGLLKMPKSALSAFGIKAAGGLAETGERLQREYAPSPSVSGGITEHPSLLVNPRWWASTMPSLAVQILPIAIAALGGSVVAPAVGAAAG